MSCIWFDPELQQYQYGSKLLFETAKSKSKTPDQFKILFEFNRTSERLLEKVFQALTVTS